VGVALGFPNPNGRAHPLKDVRSSAIVNIVASFLTLFFIFDVLLFLFFFFDLIKILKCYNSNVEERKISTVI
jgi:hypothetical protein